MGESAAVISGDSKKKSWYSSLPVKPYQLILAVLVIITVTVFWPVKDFDFIYLDDNVYVYENLHIRDGITWKGIVWALTSDIFSDDVNTDYWQPVTCLSRMIDIELFGLKAGAHHVTNVVFHVLNVLLLFLLLRRVTGAVYQSAFVAALFAVHPMQVEAVAWVTARKDVLSAFFGLLALWAYVRHRETSQKKWKGWLILFFVMGLMSKPVLITLPFAFLLLDYWPLERIKVAPFDRKAWKQAIIEKWPYALLSIASFYTTMLVISRALEPSVWVKIGNGAVSYLGNIGRMLWPTRLAMWYLHPGVDPFVPMIPFWQVAVSALAFAGLTVLILRQAKKRPYLVMGWLWYVGMIAPAIGLRPRDRAMYLPIIGLFIMISWGVAELSRRWKYRKAILGAGSVAALVALMAASSFYVGLWRNSVPLFQHTLAVTGENDLIRSNLAVLMTDNKRTEEGIKLYDAILKHNPEEVVAHNNLGNALTDLGRFQEAIPHYQEAIRLRPTYSEAHNNLGNVYKKMGKIPEALAAFQESVRLNPGQYVAIYNIASTLIDTGRPEEAVPLFEQILQLNPYYLAMYLEYGKLLEKLGRFEDALTIYKESIRREPRFEEALIRAGNIYASRGFYREAEEYYLRAVQANPKNPVTLHILANTLAHLGKYQQAVPYYVESIRLSPNDAKVHYNLGYSLTALERYDEAIGHFKTALSIEPGYVDAYLNLGHCYAKLGKFEDAAAFYEKVLEIDPNNEKVHYNAGLWLETVGKKEEAKRHYAAALAIRPDYEAARTRMRDL